jgi:hypothetical protein
LGLAKVPKPIWILVDRSDGLDGFRQPEIEIGNLTGKLVRVLGRKPLKLARDESSLLNRVGHEPSRAWPTI